MFIYKLIFLNFMNAKNVIMELIKPLDIKINGSRAWDIHVLDERFYGRILAGGSLALGESYMEKWWTCDALDVFFEKILKARLNHKIKNKLYLIGTVIKAKLTNRQSIKRAFHIGKAHYDIGNELYAAMLDKRMMYSCGYWKNAKTLDEAQDAKLDLICKKAGLKKGMKVLDIGCGWGGFAKYAAQKYKVKVVGITVSEEQANHAKRNCSGLPIEIRLQDYRELNEQFDRIISIGMFEHVGPKNYSAYMDVAHRCLKDDGIFILHTIGGNKSVTTTDLWIDRYIFPNAVLPSVKQIAEAAEGKFI